MQDYKLLTYENLILFKIRRKRDENKVNHRALAQFPLTE